MMSSKEPGHEFSLSDDESIGIEGMSDDQEDPYLRDLREASLAWGERLG